MRRALLALLLALSLAPAAHADRSTSIVGGREADEGEYPYSVYLEILGGAASCGGTLIADTWVLTAAHCADALTLVPVGGVSLESPGPLVTAVVGSRDWTEGRRITALRTLLHPDYDSGASYADVALVELLEPAGLPTAKIAGPGEEGLWTAGTQATIIGWGDTEDAGNPYPDILQEAEVPIITDADCERLNDSFDASVHVCAAYLPQGGIDTCQGDSGGPLLVPATDGALRIAGVTSFGDGCAEPNQPGVYSRIGAPILRDFVAQYVPEAIGRPAASTEEPPPAQTAGTNEPATTAPKTGTTAAKKKRRSCRKIARKAKHPKRAYKRCKKRRAAARHS